MCVRPLIVMAATCVLAGSLAAQASQSRIVECRTTSSERVHCEAGGTISTASLVRDLSSNRCGSQGSWGWTRETVWVDNSCQGEFEVRFAGSTGPGNARRILCGTLLPPRVECETDGHATSVRLIREISSNRCQRGTTWGSSDSLIWTSNGCRGDFLVTYGSGSPGVTTTPTPTNRIINCGTQYDQRVTCRTEGQADSVRMVHDLSGGQCRRGSSWGHTDSYIWVNSGCRAQFQVWYAGTGTPQPTVTNRIINCGTQYDQKVTCSTEGNATSVRLVKDLSGNQCRQGSSWGYTSSHIWVNSGCRAHFQVFYQGSGAPQPNTRTITCGSSSTSLQQCKIEGSATEVRLVRDLSGNRCRRGATWGNTDSYIWISSGCRGEFAVTYRAGPTARPVPLPAPTPAPNTRVISCGNASGSAMSCNAFGTVASMRLQRDRSSGRCNQSSAWGLDNRSIWVARGCWGDFEVNYLTAPDTR
jgi:CxxC motif-containing protein